MENKKIGDYFVRLSCRFCASENLVEILNFGNVPLAGAFIEKNDFKNEKFYPLKINYCVDCFLVQVENVISVDILFKEKYFFFSSAIKTLVKHFEEFSREIYNYLPERNHKITALEIGCNDGVLLKPLSQLGVSCIGVDPASNVTKNIKTKEIKLYNDIFTEDIAHIIKDDIGSVDFVISCYSFAHIDDMEAVMNGIDYILKNEGIFIFELYYIGTLIDNMQYDNIYHEHMSYYSIATLQKFLNKYGMEIFDIKFFPNVRSGATRFYTKYIKNPKKEITDGYRNMLADEKSKGFNNLLSLKSYSKKVKETKKRLLEILEKLKTEGKTIAGYGASGRGTTIMNYCDIDDKYLDYVIDDAPAKHGFYTPGTHLPIKPWEYIEKVGSPDYILLLAWAFVDEVLAKRKDYTEKGGKFIIPLPEVKIV